MRVNKSRLSFHSLQTGQRISTVERVKYERAVAEFPFPSNGTAHLNRENAGRFLVLLLVSIPFKRERASQRTNHLSGQNSASKVSIPFKRESASQRNADAQSWAGIVDVSIPFKRESASQLGQNGFFRGDRTEVSIPFKRESASQLSPSASCKPTCSVSIPFKRESASQHTTTADSSDADVEFPFPSNGRAHLNL